MKSMVKQTSGAAGQASASATTTTLTGNLWQTGPNLIKISRAASLASVDNSTTTETVWGLINRTACLALDCPWTKWGFQTPEVVFLGYKVWSNPIWTTSPVIFRTSCFLEAKSMTPVASYFRTISPVLHGKALLVSLMWLKIIRSWSIKTLVSPKDCRKHCCKVRENACITRVSSNFLPSQTLS